MNKRFICIRCPKGCIIDVEYEGNIIKSINGNTCFRGKEYVEEEILAPKRIVTSTVKINGAIYNVMPVTTSKPIDYNKIFDLMKLLNDIVLDAPVNMNDIVVKNVLNTGVDIIATRSMDKIKR